MREILFRGKRTDNGEWVEGFYAKAKWYLGEKEMSVIFPTDIALFPHSEISGYEEVIPESVGQYTGLTANGKKIFEGDIVRADNGHISKVVFWHGGFSLYCECHKQHTDFIPKDIIEVIGKIHDNPELLKGE